MPVNLMYLIIFGQASLSKLTSRELPDWFSKQFGVSVFNLFPGALSLQFYGIGVFELVIFLTFVVALFRREFLRLALFLSMLLFVILSLGERLTGDFATASQLFVYFAVTFALFQFVDANKLKVR